MKTCVAVKKKKNIKILNAKMQIIWGLLNLITKNTFLNMNLC